MKYEIVKTSDMLLSFERQTVEAASPLEAVQKAFPCSTVKRTTARHGDVLVYGSRGSYLYDVVEGGRA